MAYNCDVTIRKSSSTAPREIKSSAHFVYIERGITLDGSKFATGELLLEGQCLVKDNTTGKYEKYADNAGSFPAGKSNPVILDESIKFLVKDDGSNPDLTAGQVLVHGSVIKAMLIGWTQKFQDNCPHIRFV